MINYKKISRNIRLFFAALVLSVLAVPVAVELDLDSMASLKGAFVGGGSEQIVYIIEVFMFFMTGTCILLALKYFDRLWLRNVAKVKEEEKASKYFAVYMIRLALLTMPMLSGVISTMPCLQTGDSTMLWRVSCRRSSVCLLLRGWRLN